MDILEVWSEDDRAQRYWEIATSGIDPEQVSGVYNALQQAHTKDVRLDDMAAKISAMRKAESV